MITVYSFGDSFAEGHCQEVDNGISPSCKLFADSKKYHYDKNGLAGCTNLDISGQILNKIGKIKKDDYVIVYQTSYDRWNYPCIVNEDYFRFVPTELISKMKVSNVLQNINYYDYLYPMNSATPWVNDNKEYHNFEYEILSNDERELVKDYYFKVFHTYHDSYKNYTNSFFYSAINSLRDVCNNVIVLGTELWFGMDEYIKDYYNNPNVKIYCECKHWSQETHFFVSKLLENYFETKEQNKWIDSNNIERIYKKIE